MSELKWELPLLDPPPWEREIIQEQEDYYRNLYTLFAVSPELLGLGQGTKPCARSAAAAGVSQATCDEEGSEQSCLRHC